jgi:GT2 family glycosyltransferase
VSFDTREALAGCLASLHAHPPSRLGAIVVVDNASTDGSVGMTRERWPAVTVLALGRNAGFAAANNAAIRATSSPLVLLLNSDTLVRAGALDALAGRLIETGAVAAGPRLVDAAGRPEVSFGRMLSPWTELAQRARVRLAASRSRVGARYLARLLGRERWVDWVSGACLLVRRQPALDAGLLDERYFLYEEDVDFCAALRARGGRVLYTPAAEIVHLRGRSGVAPGRTGPSHYDRSHLAFYDKHAPHWAPWLRAWLRLRGRPIR